MQLIIFVACLLAIFQPLPAYAYVGPGLGLGALGVILGILVSIFLAIIGIFWYPIKRLIMKFRKVPQKNNDSQ
jgi:hypothetical protein